LTDPLGLFPCDPNNDPKCKNDGPLVPKECVGCTWGTDKDGNPIVLNQDGTPWLPTLPAETVNVPIKFDGEGTVMQEPTTKPSWWKRFLMAIGLGGAAAATTTVTSATIVATNAAIVSELGITNGMLLTTDEAIDLADDFLGEGQTIDPNTEGRYISADGTRVVRITEGDLTGHGGLDDPHFNFETLKPNPKKPGKMMIDKNYHV
jgi:hypothetical protein